jgi:uncharacterized protein YyaL (SSP411 family)
VSEPTGQNRHTNRLAKETSPYLLQHQHNPVDWYPWGPEAFEAARRADKPIFLSVGYSTCYWCHVMERQSFENDPIAAEMNQRFINIKVDREERPDVDQLYMTAVQVLTRQGGWPMSVFLTPDLRPFYGGTYFPPSDMHGRPGFVTVLKGIEDAYRNRKSDVEQSASQIVNILRQVSEPDPPERAISIDQSFIDRLIERSTSDYDPALGGFGSAPKFPRETLLELLLVHNRAQPDARRMRMIRHTLDAMANGGIRDQLGGGFHRYSTDARWLVPHFEIMLYDNAMLAWCYTEASAQMNEPRYAEVAREVLDFLLREMTSAEGAFFTALDAEVDGREGLNYLWTESQIQQVLGADDARIFNRVYGADQGPNFADPHHGAAAPDHNILFLAQPPESDAVRARLAGMRAKLKAVRDQRKQPLLDTKILTAWNALMIRTLATAGRALDQPRYIDAAVRAAEFLLSRHRTPDGGLYRTSRDGAAKYDGFVDDYSYLVQALLALHEATGQARWKTEAAGLAEVMRRKFADAERGGFYFTQAGAPDLIVRQKVASDSPLPSGNAVAAMVMLQLDQANEARKALSLFAGQLAQNAEGMSAMVQAAQAYVNGHGSIEVAAGERSGPKPMGPEQIAANVVDITASFGGAKLLNLHLNIAQAFHINAHEAGAGLIATRLDILAGAADDVDGIDYPPAERHEFVFAEQPIAVYRGTVMIGVRFKSAVPRTLKAALTYQACTENACLPAVRKELDLKLT